MPDKQSAGAVQTALRCPPHGAPSARGATHVNDGDGDVVRHIPLRAHRAPLLHGAPMSTRLGLRQVLSTHSSSFTRSQSAAVVQDSPSPWLFVQMLPKHARPVAHKDSEVQGVPSA